MRAAAAPSPPSAAGPAPPSSGLETLEALLVRIRACRACAAEFDHPPRPVLQASTTTRILICGQAPGRRVQQSGIPFDDPSGDRLRGWLGLDRAAFYGDPRIGIAPMAFCYPGTRPAGGDCPPPPRCAALWRAPLLARLPGVQLTLLVGGYAQRWVLAEARRQTLTATVAAWRSVGPSLIPLPHPSWRATGWLRRNPWFEAELLPELRARVAAILSNAP
jgi:uracil-DNA glycosylase